MFRSSHDSIIKENMNDIMQITAFKAILARRINIRGCEDYKCEGNKATNCKNQQCVVYGFQCDLCDAGYVGYTRRHLHNRVKILRHCQTLQEHARDNASGPAKAFQSA